MKRYLLLPPAAAALLLLLYGQSSEYESRSVMIPMRDGVHLHTEIQVPKDARGPLPILMVRTPYGASGESSGLTHGHRFQELARDGYIFVFQDIRGRHESEGRFVMLRPPRDHRNLKGIDEGTDTYDTIEWLLKNVSGHNGRVGIFGTSYPGWLTVMSTLEPHPALRAVSEQASPADMWIGDDFHHNGAFRLSYGFEYAAEMETSKANYMFPFDRYDTFDWYLELGPLSEVNRKYFHRTLPTWNAFVEHPDYDAYWQKLAVTPYLERVNVPDLHVAGWWDQEDFYGPVKIYATLERLDTAHRNYLVAGPWNHGGWSRDLQKLGPIDFGSDTGQYFRENIEAPWFAWWLKDKGRGDFPEARTFQTGSNRWESYSSWPPRNSAGRKLYFRASGTLSFDAPQEAGVAADTYVSDPNRPVPYRKRPIGPTYQRPGWGTWLLEDQRFVDRRPDVLTWQTAPLTEDILVAGDIVAHLFASTTGSDSDWIVKLIDVYPEEYPADSTLGGYQLMVANEVFRGRYRRSFSHPEPIRPSAVEEYTIDLHTNDHAFLRGHRIMVQVQSTWFPLIDRNPQKFVANIYQASVADFQAATQSVYRSKQYPSNIELPLQP